MRFDKSDDFHNDVAKKMIARIKAIIDLAEKDETPAVVLNGIIDTCHDAQEEIYEESCNPYTFQLMNDECNSND